MDSLPQIIKKGAYISSLKSSVKHYFNKNKQYGNQWKSPISRQNTTSNGEI